MGRSYTRDEILDWLDSPEGYWWTIDNFSRADKHSKGFFAEVKPEEDAGQPQSVEWDDLMPVSLDGEPPRWVSVYPDLRDPSVYSTP